MVSQCLFWFLGTALSCPYMMEMSTMALVHKNFVRIVIFIGGDIFFPVTGLYFYNFT
jgi:hypothetical protein